MKQTWESLAQIATWLIGLVTLFVVNPPRLAVDDPPPTIDRFVQFTLAILIAIAFAIFARRKAQRRLSAALSGALLAAALLFFGSYLYFGDHWTCRYDTGSPMVIGQTYSSVAAMYLSNNPGLDCAGLIRDFAGQTSTIWPRAELVNRRLILSALFAGTVICFALSALFAVRAVSGRDLQSAMK